jgi:hypothetical protein
MTDTSRCARARMRMVASTPVLDQVADLALLRTNALSHTVLGTTMPRPSGFFPACGFHDGAHTDDGF